MFVNISLPEQSTRTRPSVDQQYSCHVSKMNHLYLKLFFNSHVLNNNQHLSAHQHLLFTVFPLFQIIYDSTTRGCMLDEHEWRLNIKELLLRIQNIFKEIPTPPSQIKTFCRSKHLNRASA